MSDEKAMPAPKIAKVQAFAKSLTDKLEILENDQKSSGASQP